MQFAQAQNQAAETGFAKVLDPIKSSYSELETAQKNVISPLDLYKTQEQEAGLPARREAVGKLRSETTRLSMLLDSLEPDVNNRLANVMTTQSQRNRVVASEGEPLRRALGQTGLLLSNEAQDLAGAEGRAVQLTGLASEGQQQRLRPFETRLGGQQYTGGLELGMLKDRLARESGGFETEYGLAKKIEAEQRNLAQEKELAKYRAGLTKGTGGSDFNTLLQYLDKLRGGGDKETKPTTPPGGGGGGKDYKATLDSIFAPAKIPLYPGAGNNNLSGGQLYGFGQGGYGPQIGQPSNNAGSLRF